MVPKIKRSSVTGQPLLISFLPASMLPSSQDCPWEEGKAGREARSIDGESWVQSNCRSLRTRASCRGATQPESWYLPTSIGSLGQDTGPGPNSGHVTQVLGDLGQVNPSLSLGLLLAKMRERWVHCGAGCMFSGAVHRGTGQNESHMMSTGHPEPAYHGCRFTLCTQSQTRRAQVSLSKAECLQSTPALQVLAT